MVLALEKKLVGSDIGLRHALVPCLRRGSPIKPKAIKACHHLLCPHFKEGTGKKKPAVA